MPLFRQNQADGQQEEIKFSSPIELAIIDADGDSIFIPDASITEGHRSEIEYTSNPVEFGAEITDHSIILPRTIVIEGRITNTPLRKNDDLFSDVYDASETSIRASGAWEFLNNIANERELISVRTNLKTYDNMALRVLETEQDAQTSQVLDFRAEFREIFIVRAPDTETIEITLPQGDTSEQATPTLTFGDLDPVQLSPVEANSVNNTVSTLEFSL
jgi:hypothetical protein